MPLSGNLRFLGFELFTPALLKSPITLPGLLAGGEAMGVIQRLLEHRKSKDGVGHVALHHTTKRLDLTPYVLV